MVADEHGFPRPVIDKKICVNCGRCAAVCPVVRKDGLSDAVMPVACFAARSMDVETVMESSSGGIFSELARQVIDGGGAVFGCVLEDCVAHHEMAVDMEGVARMRGSKYVQSDMRNCYRECKRELESGRRVLFSGVPCQIAGLKAYLGREFDDLLTVGIICHGVAAPDVLKVYVENESSRLRKSVVGVKFRDKKPYSNSISLSLELDDGTMLAYKNGFSESAYMQAFLGSYSYRENCFSCQFRSGRCGADIVLGDFWGIQHVTNKFDVCKGVSAVLLYSATGVRMFEKMSVDLLQVQYLDVSRENANLDNDPICPKGHRKFMRLYKEMTVAAAYQMASAEPMCIRAYRKLRRLAGRVKRSLMS